MEGAILSKGKSIGQRNHGGSSYAKGDMITSSEGLGLEPCNGNSSSNPSPILRNQVPRVGRVRILNNNKYSQMKRKLEQYTGDGKSTVAFGLNFEKSDNGTGKKLKRGESSSILCSPNCIDNIGSLKGKHVSTTLPPPNDTDCVMCYREFSHLNDSNGSINGSYPKKNLLENHSKESKLPVTGNVRLSIQEKPKIDSLEEVSKSCAKEDLDDSRGTKSSRSLENEDKKHNEAITLSLSYSNVDRLPRPVIPIGPKFQADIPKWEGTMKKVNKNDDDNDSKWFGTQIWPMKGRTLKTNVKAVGKGKPSLCECESPGSVNCVKQHVSEARLRLKYDIGSAFWSWKFNEMGENVSMSWTWSEEKKFESLVKRNPLLSKLNFWKLACENFPSRSMKSMINYYYNVYILRRMSLDTRSSFGEVESDDD